MAGKGGKACSLHASNRISYEDLDNIEDSFFEGVYKEADRTLYKIVKDDKLYSGEEGKDDTSLNVLSFLGKRGRGKTSTMLSFLFYLNKLYTVCEWSEFYKNREKSHEKIKFITLPYIDAAMLAENEYIFDIILAEMWNEFENHLESKIRGIENEDTEYLEQKIKRTFINVRKAYLTLKEREKVPVGRQDKDTLAPSALHDLAGSLNLCSEMKKLVNDYLKIFSHGETRHGDRTYLVITIDDIDMSADKAQPILEQIRRFLRIPRVVVLLTADIERLQKACEARYRNIYVDARDLRHFVDEYLEKVLPYNMRMYMPEVKDRYDDIPIKATAKEELGLLCADEKGMILEFIARKCGIHFNGKRKKRHFLQNQSMRSMVNYFEQLVRIRDMDYLSWLKVDLRERLVERIQETEQREFVSRLLSKDYEDINEIVINYINQTLSGQKKIEVTNRSLGQVLYGCSLLEKEDFENVDFVNSILMLYSILLKEADADLYKKIIGHSALGEWEYSAILDTSTPSDISRGFNNKEILSINIEEYPDDITSKKKLLSFLDTFLHKHRETITAWIYCILFIEIIPLTKEPTFSRIENITFDIKNEVRDKKLVLEPIAFARKKYFQCLYETPEKIYANVFDWLKAAIISIGEYYGEKNASTETEKVINIFAEEKASQLLDEIGLSDPKKQNPEQEKRMNEANKASVIPAWDVEIFYTIGRRLETCAVPFSNREQDLFDGIALRYREIQSVLEEIDSYYKALKQPTDFTTKFCDSLQAKLLLGPVEMTDSLREKFVRMFGTLLQEAVGTRVVVKTPER